MQKILAYIDCPEKIAVQITVPKIPLKPKFQSQKSPPDLHAMPILWWGPWGLTQTSLKVECWMTIFCQLISAERDVKLLV